MNTVIDFDAPFTYLDGSVAVTYEGVQQRRNGRLIKDEFVHLVLTETGLRVYLNEHGETMIDDKKTLVIFPVKKLHSEISPKEFGRLSDDVTALSRLVHVMHDDFLKEASAEIDFRQGLQQQLLVVGNQLAGITDQYKQISRDIVPDEGLGAELEAVKHTLKTLGGKIVGPITDLKADLKNLATRIDMKIDNLEKRWSSQSDHMAKLVQLIETVHAEQTTLSKTLENLYANTSDEVTEGFDRLHLRLNTLVPAAASAALGNRRNKSGEDLGH